MDLPPFPSTGELKMPHALERSPDEVSLPTQLFIPGLHCVVSVVHVKGEKIPHWHPFIPYESDMCLFDSDLPLTKLHIPHSSSKFSHQALVTQRIHQLCRLFAIFATRNRGYD